MPFFAQADPEPQALGVDSFDPAGEYGADAGEGVYPQGNQQSPSAAPNASSGLCALAASFVPASPTSSWSYKKYCIWSYVCHNRILAPGHGAHLAPALGGPGN